MYFTKRSRDFEVSIKRLKRSGAKLSVRKKIEETIDILASGEKLPLSHRDHKLTGELSAYRECHIMGDLLLIYKIEKDNLILFLVNIGSHSELF